jgi:hypothetical protein
MFSYDVLNLIVEFEVRNDTDALLLSRVNHDWHSVTEERKYAKYGYKKYFRNLRAQDFRFDNFDITQWVMRENKGKISQAMMLRVLECGSLEVAEWAIRTYKLHKHRGFCGWMIAAMRGRNIDIIRIIKGMRIHYNSKAIGEAALSGDLIFFQKVLDSGFIPKPDTMLYAAQGGNINIVKWLISVRPKGRLPWALIKRAFRSGNLELIDYLQRTCKLWPTWTQNDAARGGHLQLLQTRSNFIVDSNHLTLIAAIQSRNMEVIKWVLTQGKCINVESCDEAVKTNDMQIITLIVERPTAKNLIHAIRMGNLNMIKLFRKRGAPWPPKSETLTDEPFLVRMIEQTNNRFAVSENLGRLR